MVGIRVEKADMPQVMQKGVIEAFKTIYSTVKSENPSVNYESLAKALKTSLDNLYGPHWHVVVGLSFTFHVRYRVKRVIIVSYGELKILAFQSPPYSSSELTTALQGARKKLPEGEPRNRRQVRVLKTTFEKADETKVTSTIHECTGRSMEPESLSSDIKKNLTVQTLQSKSSWHVLVSKKGDFGFSLSDDVRMCNMMIGDQMALVFQHNQEETVPTVGDYDYAHLYTFIPMVLLTIALLFYVFYHSACDQLNGQVRQEGTLLDAIRRYTWMSEEDLTWSCEWSHATANNDMALAAFFVLMVTLAMMRRQYTKARRKLK